VSWQGNQQQIYTTMKRLLFQNIVILLLATTSKGQLKVANYSVGKFGTDKYEHLEFWTKDG